MTAQLPLTITGLLDLDGENANETRRWLGEASPVLLAALDDAGSLYVSLSRAFGQGATDDADKKVFSEAGLILGADADSLTRGVWSAPKNLSKAKRRALRGMQAALDRAYSRRVRGLLMSACYRWYMWSATDLVRLRVTSSLGHLRLQAEAASLARLILDEPPLARTWMNTPLHRGKAFFDRNQARMRRLISAHGLKPAYDRASGAALHVRAPGLALGFTQQTGIDRGRRTHTVGVSFQEVDAERNDLLLQHFVNLLDTQAHVIPALMDAAPEAADPILQQQRIPRFVQTVARLSKDVRKLSAQMKASAARK